MGTIGTLDRLPDRYARINVRQTDFDYGHMAYLVRLDRNRKIAALYLLMSIILFVLSVYALW